MRDAVHGKARDGSRHDRNRMRFAASVLKRRTVKPQRSGCRRSAPLRSLADDRYLVSPAIMNEPDIEQVFWQLCRVADEADTLDASVPDLEPHLLAILHLVKRHPGHRDLFVRCFVSLVDGSRSCTNWIPLFCMRELRWPEVRDAANLRLELAGGARAPRLMNWISHINWAYDDAPWEDAAFFRYFWEREFPGEPWPCERPT